MILKEKNKFINYILLFNTFDELKFMMNVIISSKIKLLKMKRRLNLNESLKKMKNIIIFIILIFNKLTHIYALCILEYFNIFLIKKKQQQALTICCQDPVLRH